MNADELRSGFLKFFEKNGHAIKDSSSLVPENDPSLMFTNSGMVQFKNIFTGLEKSDCKRAVTAQRCLRAGGKHNDLENVGYTKRHHTFFEMLGNFSFGDYFKEQAIVYAWDFLTKELGLGKDKLLVTVYHEDYEALTLWKKISGLPDRKIIKISTSDNFWQMGDSGPCGPCSEIFYDNGEREEGEVDGVEIWNLVFMQYDLRGGEKTPLPKPCVDTGMGLERMLAVLEGKRDNYDTSLFAPIVDEICDTLGLKKKVAFAEGSEQRSSIKVIADHARACALMLGDGMVPSNEGRGYVLRRIMRRAMRHAISIDQRQPRFVPPFSLVVYGVLGTAGEIFKSLQKVRNPISNMIGDEERSFTAALQAGVKLLEAEVAKIAGMQTLPGEVAFMLYDTYGFPLDLTEDALRERGVTVDRAGFEAAMAEQRQRGRAAWVDSGTKAKEAIWFELATRIEPTKFCGYEKLKIVTQVQAIVKDGKDVNTLREGEGGTLIFAKTPFYVEAGGQQGDRGYVASAGFIKQQFAFTKNFEIVEVQYAHNKRFVLHNGTVKKDDISIGDTMHLFVYFPRRLRLSIHHTATHLLHAALRKILGEHAQQRGSQITAEYLRFDFSHPAPLTENERREIQGLVNYFCLSDLLVEVQEMSRVEADKKGAMALFGEKYGEKVRVVTIDHWKENIPPVSVELCGGTHVSKTSAIGSFKITAERSVGSGIRRIEAIAGPALTAHWEEQAKSLREQNEKLQLQLKQAKEAILVQRSSKGAGSSGALVRELGELEPKQLKPLADRILKSEKLPAIALASKHAGKVSIVLALTPATAKTLSAIEIIKPAQEILQAKGGGKATLVQIGSSAVDKLPAALKVLENILAETFADNLAEKASPRAQQKNSAEVTP